jgi:hypothetical protein
MARAAKKRLKVFQASLGFFDSVVAVSSRPAALEAWGVRQNLFADGQAKPATDAAAIEAALAHPGTPLRRAAGSHGPFELDPGGLPDVPDAPKPKAKAAAPKAAPAAKPKPAPDRRALDHAEAALHAFDQARKVEEADFRRRREALDAEETEAQQAYVKGRRAAKDKLDAARQAYTQAGGEA